MPESEITKTEVRRKYRYRGRLAQIPIYFGKHLRSFVYLNDWKVLPMAAIIAAVVSMVVKNDCFLTVEGTFKGALALTCVAIWNGCFNSVQVICRERQIVKREHRSGLHISSYIISHMLYQALLCIAQTAVTLYVCKIIGIHFPEKGFMTPYMMFDMGITLFLVSYSADMLSLLISAVARTTTAAMTVIPFVLIFQLVFSGGMFSLPSWASNVSDYSISRYGIACLNAQAGYNELPTVTVWNTMSRIRYSNLEGDISVGQILDFLEDESNPAAVRFRQKTVSETETVGDLVDEIAALPEIRENRDRSFHFSVSVDEIIRAVGEDKVRERIGEMSSAAARIPAYATTRENILDCWGNLIGFSLLFAFLAMVVLEFIDRDKR